MAKQIRVPDGSIVEFPDAMSDDEISQVLSEQFPAPESPSGFAPESTMRQPEMVPPPAVQATPPPNQGWWPSTPGGGAPPQLPKQFTNPDPAYDPSSRYNLLDAVSTIIPGSDEAIGAGRAGLAKLKGEEQPLSELTDTEIEKYRTDRDAFNREHPGMAIAAPIAGGLAIDRATGGKLTSGGLLKMTGKGAGLGLLEGFGAGEGPISERLEPAFKGGVLGMVGGAGGYVLGKIFKGLFSPDTPEQKAVNRLDEALKDGDITPETAMDRLRQMRSVAPDAVLADVDEAIARLARAVHTRGGKGANEMTNQMDIRGQDQRERMRDLVRANISPDDSNTTYDVIKAQRRVDDKKNFANVTGTLITPRLQGMLNSPVVQRAMQKGLETEQTLAAARGTPFNPYDYGITGTGQNGLPIVEGTPNMRLWHAIKTGLDDELDTYRNQVTGKLNLDQKGNSIEELRRNLVEELRKNDSYRYALDASREPAQSMNALEAGRNFMTGDWDMVIERFEKLDPIDKNYYRMGVARKMQEDIDTLNRSGKDVTGGLLAPTRLRRLQGILPPEQYDTLVNSIRTERDMAQTNAMVTGGSQTAPRAADVSEPTPAGDVVRGATDLFSPQGRVSLMQRVINSATGDVERGMSRETANLLAPMVTTSDDAAMRALVDRLNRNRTQNLFTPMETFPTMGLLGLETGRGNLYEANSERR